MTASSLAPISTDVQLLQKPEVSIKDYVTRFGWYVAITVFGRADEDLPTRWVITKPQMQTMSAQRYYIAGSVQRINGESVCLTSADILQHFSTYNLALAASQTLAAELNR